MAQVIQGWSRCQSLGIRVADAEGNIPYESRVGVDHDFCQVGRSLSTRQDDCFCVRAITQQLEESDLAVKTPGGSFRCDDTRQFVSRLASESQAHYRGNCIRNGFTSLAVIPIRYRDQVLGVLHLGDPRPRAISPQTVTFIESIAPLIGEAVHRFNAEAELARYREHLEELVHDRTDDLERSNDDLEQFAYVASHDLQEPLRAGGQLRRSSSQRRYQGKLDAEADEYIDLRRRRRHPHAAADRRPAGLLPRRHARQSSAAHRRRRCPRRRALATCSAGIDESRRPSSTPTRCPPSWPTPAQLAQLFQNLIGNAIKFRGDRPPAHPRCALRPAPTHGSSPSATTASASTRSTPNASS